MDYIYGKLNFEAKEIDYGLEEVVIPAIENLHEYNLTKEGVPIGTTIVVPKHSEPEPVFHAETILYEDTKDFIINSESGWKAGSLWAGVNIGEERKVTMELVNLDDSVKDSWSYEVIQVFWKHNETDGRLYFAVGYSEENSFKWNVKYYSDAESLLLSTLRFYSDDVLSVVTVVGNIS